MNSNYWEDKYERIKGENQQHLKEFKWNKSSVNQYGETDPNYFQTARLEENSDDQRFWIDVTLSVPKKLDREKGQGRLIIYYTSSGQHCLYSDLSQHKNAFRLSDNPDAEWLFNNCYIVSINWGYLY